MASEPAEPTTRPQDELIDKTAQAITRNAELIAVVVKACKCCASSGYTPGGGAPYPSECAWCNHEPDRHGEKELAKLRGPVSAALSGLLADPAQTTELERLRERVTLNQQLNADSQRVARKARAQRDALSLLLRGMARKLVAYRKWTTGETPTIHKLFDALRAEASTADDVTMSAIRLMNRAGVERDQRQARIEAALAKLNASDQATSWEAMYDLVVEAKAILRGWASAEPAGEAIAVEELRRAALVGDPPTEADFAPFADESREIAELTLPAAVEAFHLVESEGDHLPLADRARMWREGQPLSGVALRDVEEADDASEPACECFVVPVEQWTRHYDATEPGSMVEQNPDCPVHPAKRADDAAGDLP